MKFGKSIKKYILKMINNKYILKYKFNISDISIKYTILKKFLKNIKPVNNINIEDDYCSLCLDKLNNNYIILPCNHNYHPICLINMLSVSTNTICPLCRNNIINYYKNNIEIENNNLNNMKYIIQFLCMLKNNINYINILYKNINNKINELIKNYNITNYDLENYNICLCINKKKLNIINDIKELKNILNEFEYYNYNGIKKIIKKFKKNININIDDFIYYLIFNINE